MDKMNKNESMNFIGKLLTDRDLYGNSMSLAKIMSNSKTNKKDKAAFSVFQDDIKALLPIAFNVFKSRMSVANTPENVENMNEFNDNEKDRQDMFNAINTIIDEIGVVGPGKIANTVAIYHYAVNTSFKFFDVYHDEALLIKSQLVNAKKQLKDYLDAPNGVNKEAITTTSTQVDRLTKKLDELKKKPGSVTLEWRQIGETAFISSMEKFLCKLAKKQNPMDADEYKAFKKAMREESKAKAKKTTTKKEETDKK